MMLLRVAFLLVLFNGLLAITWRPTSPPSTTIRQTTAIPARNGACWFSGRIFRNGTQISRKRDGACVYGTYCNDGKVTRFYGLFCTNRSTPKRYTTLPPRTARPWATRTYPTFRTFRTYPTVRPFRTFPTYRTFRTYPTIRPFRTFRTRYYTTPSRGTTPGRGTTPRVPTRRPSWTKGMCLRGSRFYKHGQTMATFRSGSSCEVMVVCVNGQAKNFFRGCESTTRRPFLV